MPVSEELLEILVCPETKQPVAMASEELIAELNLRIRAGKHCATAAARPVDESHRGGVASARTARSSTSVDDGIPVMLIEESIEL